MKHPTSQRKESIDHLGLRLLAARTVQFDTDWIVHLARFHRCSPEPLGHPEISTWLLHLIRERKLSVSSIYLAINAPRPIPPRSLNFVIRRSRRWHRWKRGRITWKMVPDAPPKVEQDLCPRPIYSAQVLGVAVAEVKCLPMVITQNPTAAVGKDKNVV